MGEPDKNAKLAPVGERLKPDTRLKIFFDDDDESSNQNEGPARFITGYWSIRGLAAPIRAMLSAAQMNHEVVLYDQLEASGETSGWDMTSYFEDRTWLREEDSFVNLPFLVDTKRNLVLAQTNAIFNYLGRELNMQGKDEVDLAKCDEMLNEVMDLRNKMVAFAYRSQTASKKEAMATLKQAKVHLRKFEAHLSKCYPNYFQDLEQTEGKGPKTAEQAKAGIAHLIPDCFTAPDFHLWEMLDQFEGMCKYYELPFWAESGEEQTTAINFQSRPDVNPETRLFPHLEEFRHCFMTLPENVPYYGSFLHKGIPCNNCSGKFASCYKDFRPYTRGQAAPWRKKGVVIVRHKKSS